MHRRTSIIVVIAAAAAISHVWIAERPVTAQARPRLADYYTTLPERVVDATYNPRYIGTPHFADLNGDGNQELLVLGQLYNIQGNVCCQAQPGRLLLGDGAGGFTPAPAALFPVDTLLTQHANHVWFGNFNGDALPDMFVSANGFEGPTNPCEQNRLYLSTPEGGWRDATANLPQIVDFSHSSSVGDISGRGRDDIFVGNGYGGGCGTRPYTLLNTGSGQFVQTSTNIPAGMGQLLGLGGRNFAASTLADLNGDNLPELIIAGETGSTAPSNLNQSTILWNRSGQFVETDITRLSLLGGTYTTHRDSAIQKIDVNRDGLPDLVLTGGVGSSQSGGGWFVQIFVNRGGKTFVDETAERIAAAGDRESVVAPESAGIEVRQVFDFNEDGAPDFYADVRAGSTGRLDAGQPLIWLNDGTGHFTTLKIRDFVAPGLEDFFSGAPRMVATKNGYSFISTNLVSGQGLKVRGVMATKPYRVRGYPTCIFGAGCGAP